MEQKGFTFLKGQTLQTLNLLYYTLIPQDDYK